MARTSPPVGLDFLTAAPVKKTLQINFAHPPEVVFAAIAQDPAGWGSWFPGFSHTGRYVTPDPQGAGSVREMQMRSSTLRETVLAWDAPSRWAFYISGGRIPGVRRLAEDYRIEAQPGGSRLTWTIAIEPAPLARPVAPLVLALGASSLRKAGANLDRLLSEGYRPDQP
jgi:carbon monoxide dehydrogenase subunit G